MFWLMGLVVPVRAPVRWRKRSRRLLGCAAVAVVSMLLATPVFAAEDDAPDELIVPPGQDELLAQMLGWGVVLPGQCQFTGGLADGPIVEGKYACPAGEVVLELTHSSVGAPEAILTENFAITVESGLAPYGLTEAVALLVRSRESGFEWKWRTEGDDVFDQGNAADDQAPTGGPDS